MHELYVWDLYVKGNAQEAGLGLQAIVLTSCCRPANSMGSYPQNIISIIGSKV